MNLIKWFDYNARLLAKQLPKEYSTNTIDVIPFILPVSQLPSTVSLGIANWLLSFHCEIVFISIRSGLEANYLVFLDRDMNKFHETYLVSD